MKTFTRNQIREVLAEFTNSDEKRNQKIVFDFVDYLETYQFVDRRLKKGDVMTRAVGSVKWFNDKKGFGFIMPDEGGDEIFVHFSNLNGIKTLQEGQRVEFDVESSNKGLRAVDVVLI